MGRKNYPPRDLSDEALAHVVRLHSGSADRKDWDDFRRWRATSADHEAAAAEAEALWNAASDLSRDPKTGLIRPKHQKALSRRKILGIAGAGIAVASGLWSLDVFRPLKGDHVTGIAETRVITLPDGSRAFLNALSAINVDFTPERRLIELVEGQAYFEVAGGRVQPFEVRVGAVTVTALGTAFDANRNLPDGEAAIAVTEHSVRVASAAEQSVVVKEGERIIIADDGRLGPVSVEDRVVAIAWQSGQYIAEDRPLGEVVAALSSYHRGWIIIDDARLHDLRVNAVLDLRNPDASIAALTAGLAIRMRRISPLIIMISGA